MRRIALVIAVAACSAKVPQNAPTGAYCTPREACWPDAAAWATIDAHVPAPVIAPCVADAKSAACTAALAALANPFFRASQPGTTQSSGWFDAWEMTPSAYAVTATSAADVAAAVRFARAHRIRLVIRGTGHDYLGRSTAPDSLMVWTHAMRDVVVHDAFAPRCGGAAEPAISLGAGTHWLDAYAAARQAGRYVQGGGCTSVGAAGGFVQGGGYGSWSKQFGLAASNLLEAEVVLADGRTVIANACSEPDLFWALRGGGGGTFGVVTRVTYRTHALPSHVGGVFGAVRATSEPAFLALVTRFLAFYREALGGPHWGEQVTLTGANALELSMLFQGLTAAEAEARWAPFRDWVRARPNDYTWQVDTFAMPGASFWDPDILEQQPGVLTRDTRDDAPRGYYWWSTNNEELGMYWHAYTSRYLPLAQFAPDAVAGLAATLVAASRHWSVALHFNKAQGDAAPDAIARGRATAVNPVVFESAALAIVAAGEPAHPGVDGHAPDRTTAVAERARVAQAIAILRAATPASGAYGNEGDYFEPDWQRSFWGANYARLLAIKRRVDPTNVFTCHHCVGSDVTP